MKHARRPLSPKKAEVLPSQLHRSLVPPRTMPHRTSDNFNTGYPSAPQPPSEHLSLNERLGDDTKPLQAHRGHNGFDDNPDAVEHRLTTSSADVAQDVTVVVSEATVDDGRSLRWRDAIRCSSPRSLGPDPTTRHHAFQPSAAKDHRSGLTAYQKALDDCRASLLPQGRRLPQQQAAQDKLHKLEQRRALMVQYTRPLGVVVPPTPALSLVPSRSSSAGAKRSRSADEGCRPCAHTPHHHARLGPATASRSSTNGHQRRNHSVPSRRIAKQSDAQHPMSLASSLNVSQGTTLDSSQLIVVPPPTLSASASDLPSHSSSSIRPPTRMSDTMPRRDGSAHGELPSSDSHTNAQPGIVPVVAPTSPSAVPTHASKRQVASTTPDVGHLRPAPAVVAHTPSARSSVSPASSSGFSVTVEEEQLSVRSRVPLTPLSCLTNFATPRPLRRDAPSPHTADCGASFGMGWSDDTQDAVVHPAVVIVRQLTQPRPCFSSDALLVDISKKAELHAITRLVTTSPRPGTCDGDAEPSSVKEYLGDAIHMVPSAMLEQCERRSTILACFRHWRASFHKQCADRVRCTTFRLSCFNRWRRAVLFQQQSRDAVWLQRHHFLRCFVQRRLVSTTVATRFRRFCVLRHLFLRWSDRGSRDAPSARGADQDGAVDHGAKAHALSYGGDAVLVQMPAASTPAPANPSSSNAKPIDGSRNSMEYEVFDGYPLMVAHARCNAAMKSLVLRYWRAWLISTRYASYRRELDQLAARSCRSRTLLAVWHKWANAMSRVRARRIEARVLRAAALPDAALPRSSAAATQCVPPALSLDGGFLPQQPRLDFAAYHHQLQDRRCSKVAAVEDRTAITTTTPSTAAAAAAAAADAPLPASLAAQREEWQRVLVGEVAVGVPSVGIDTAP